MPLERLAGLYTPRMLDDLLSHCDSILLETRRMQTWLNQLRIFHIAINRLPIEIYQTIVEYALACHQTWATSNKNPYYQTLGRLRLVCKHWSTVLLGMPSLWAHIWMNQPEPEAAACIKRAGQQPLHIWLNEVTRGAVVKSTYENVALQTHAQWRSLHVRSTTGLPKRLNEGSLKMSSLRELRLTGESQVMLLKGTFLRSLNENCPNLRSVRMFGVEIGREGASFLTRLSSLIVITHPRQRFPIINILSACQSLVRLEVEVRMMLDLTKHPSFSSGNAVALPNLQSFRLTCFDADWFGLMDALDVPTECKVTLNYARRTMYGTDRRAFASAILPSVLRRTKALLEFASRDMSMELSISEVNGQSAMQIGDLDRIEVSCDEGMAFEYIWATLLAAVEIQRRVTKLKILQLCGEGNTSEAKHRKSIGNVAAAVIKAVPVTANTTPVWRCPGLLRLHLINNDRHTEKAVKLGDGLVSTLLARQAAAGSQADVAALVELKSTDIEWSSSQLEQLSHVVPIIGIHTEVKSQ